MKTKLVTYITFLLVTVCLGAFAGAFTWAFFFLMNAGLQLLWEDAPALLESVGMPAVFYPIGFCAIGGIVIGLFHKHWGDYPKEMNVVLAEVKKTGRYEYDHLGASFFGALLPLMFGGSVGPEAGLTGVIAGLCTWVTDRLKFLKSELSDVAAAGTAAVIAAIFNAPLFGLIAPVVGSTGDSESGTVQIPKAKKFAVYVLAVAGALGAFMLLSNVFGGGMGLPHFGDLHVGKRELIWSLPILALAIFAGWLNAVFSILTGKVSHKIGNRPVLKATIAGLLLGACGVVLPFSMFAGETQAEVLTQDWQTFGAFVLIATGLLKVFTTQLCLNFGWSGGHFFPLIFSGVAIGYGCAALLGIDPTYAVCLSSSALLGVVMRQPVMTVLLLFLCFPVKGAAFMLAAAAIGSVIPVPHKAQEKKSHADTRSLRR